MTKRRVLVIPLITLVIMTALSAMAPLAHAAGGDFSIDFAAADPGTYDHGTAVGGVFADKVESLEGGDFVCGDKVVYLAQITVAGGATGKQDIELDFGFLAEPTGQPGVGMGLPLSVSPNPGDAGTGTADTTTSIVGTPAIDTSGSTDELQATVRVNNLDPGEVFILRVVVSLTCIPNSSPTGNLQGALLDANQVAPIQDDISAGNQTVPFKSVASVIQDATVSVTLGQCVPSVGSSVTPVTVVIAPAGSASVTVNGPGGYTHTFTGSGGTVSLDPGAYTWTATAETGFALVGASSGQFTVADCALTPTTVNVSLGDCVPAVGSSSTPVTVTINPTSGASVTVNGPGGYTHTFTGSGGTVSLDPGAYTWTATAASGFAIVGQSSGSFTVADCALTPTTVSVELGDCVPAIGSSSTPVTVTIDPDSGASVTIDGPGGYTHTFTGTGGTVSLDPGAYAWTATAEDGFAIVGADSGEFTVADCALTPTTVTVTVGECPVTSSETKPVEVAIAPDGGASVTVTGPDGYNRVVGGDGDTLQLAEGTYSWTAAANEGFAIVGAAEGTFEVEGCIIEVLPKTIILPKTGSDLPGAGIAGFAFVMLGVVMVAASHRARRPAVSVGATGLIARLSGRTAWDGPRPRLVLGSLDTSAPRRAHLRWARRRGGRSGRAGPVG
jgi:hypothetical protein